MDRGVELPRDPYLEIATWVESGSRVGPRDPDGQRKIGISVSASGLADKYGVRARGGAGNYGLEFDEAGVMLPNSAWNKEVKAYYAEQMTKPVVDTELAAEALDNLTAKIKGSHGSIRDRFEFAGFVLEKWWKGK